MFSIAFSSNMGEVVESNNAESFYNLGFQQIFNVYSILHHINPSLCLYP